jgi:hypothetical protein
LAEPNDAIGGGMAAGLVAMTSVIEAKAMHETSTWTNAHQAETISMVAEFAGTDAMVIAKGARFTDADYLEPRYLQPLIEIIANQKLIDQSFPPQDLISSVAVKTTLEVNALR